MKQPKVIYEGIIIRGALPSGAGQDLLTINPLTGRVGSISGTPLTATLGSGQIFVGNASNIATAVNVTGDITISNTGVTSITPGSIVNADINATASIAFSKMAVQTASRLLGTDGTGFATTITATTTEANYLSGVTSAIQTQLNAKQATITGGATSIVSANLALSRALVSDASGKVAVSATTNTQIGYLSTLTSNVQTQLDSKLAAAPGVTVEGDIIYYNGTIWTNLPRGTSGQTLTSTASTIQWSSVVGNGIPSGGTTDQYLRKDSNADYDVVWDTLDLSKITDVTASAADVNILAGAVTAGVTDTIIGYLSGLSSNVQTQLDNKRNNDLPQNAIWRGNGSNQAEAYPAGTDGYILTVVGGVPTWAIATPPGNVSGVAPSTDNALVRWNGVAADSIQNSGIIISDSNNMLFPTAGSIDTSTSNGNTLLLRAYNTGGASYTTMATLTAGATPTLDFNTSATIGTAYIYRAGGTDVAVADGGTNISSYTAGDILYATGATTLAKLPVSTNGFVLTLNAGLPVWAAGGGGGGGSLTATYVGYGDGANTLTGEAAFTYNATDNILTVPRIAYTATASDPVATVVDGQLTYNSTDLDFRGRINGEWTNITRPGTSSKNATYLIAESERNYITLVDTSGGAVTIDISVDLSPQWCQTFINTGTNAINFTASGGMTLNAVATSCTTQWGWVTLTRSGSNTYYATGALGSGGGAVSSVSGTTNRITVSPTIGATVVDIAATYVGQSSITTLGTIGTGVWQGTSVGVTYGGTGANLSATGGAGQYIKQITTGANFTVGTIPASDIASGAALTRVDDTNVTLTLGGTPATALLAATSLTLGWAGQLAVTRGGTGLSTVSQGDILYGSASNVLSALAKNTSATRYLSNTGGSNNPAWAQIDLTNGVTGILPIANGGTGSATQNFWALTGTSTLTGTTVIANGGNPLTFSGTGVVTFNGTATTSPFNVTGSYTVPGGGAVSSYLATFGGTIIGKGTSNDGITGVLINSTLTNSTGTAVTQIGLRVAPTFNGSIVSGPLQIALQVVGGSSTALTELIRAANSAGQDRWKLRGDGTQVWTTTLTGSDFGGTISSPATNTGHLLYSLSIGGSSTVNLTSYFQRYTGGLTTNATGSVNHSIWDNRSHTINHTGVVISGYLFDPSIAGSQAGTETIYAFRAASGFSGFGTVTPTGIVHIGAGSATVAQFKLNSTTVLTTALAGVMEYNGNWYKTTSAALRLGIGGVIHTNTTTTGNIGVGEDTLFSYSLPAGSLGVNKDSIDGVAAGTFGASVNSKRIRVKFGATTIFDSGALAISLSTDWTLEFQIIRTGATTQKCNCRLTTSSGTLSAYADYATSAETLSGAVTFLITGEGTADNDIVGEMFKINFNPAEA